MINELWLQTFTTLVEQKHFTKTAETLNMTQPGVSQHIKKLEESLGYMLLNRVGKSFELTREGEILYDFALRKREDELELMDILSSEDETEGEIKVACSGTLAMIFYPIFLERQNNYPKLKIYLEAAPDYLIEKKVLSSEVDIGITTSQTELGNISEREVGKEELCIVYPRGVISPKHLCADVLDEIGFVDHPDGRIYLERLLKANLKGSQTARAISSVTYVNQINQILMPVSMGLGFTVMPKRFVKNFSKGLEVSILRNKVPVFDKYYLIQKQNKTLGRKYNWFLETIVKLLQ